VSLNRRAADLLGRRATKLMARSVAGRKVQRRINSMTAKTRFPLRAPRAPYGIDVRTDGPKVGADFSTDWARSPQAKAARIAMVETVMRAAVAGIASPNRVNIDRLADLDGPAIFVANHHSHLDTSLLLTSIPLPWRHEMVVAAASDYFFRNRVTGALAALTIGAIPIERAKVGRSSANLAADVIDDGYSLLIFPEGGRSRDGWGQPFRGGAAYLSARCNAPVVPVYVGGSGRIWRKGSSKIRRGSTVINFGKPIWPGEGESSRSFNKRIEAAVSVLGDETTADWYTARKRAYSGASPALGGPNAGSWRRQWALGSTRKRKSTEPRWPKV